MADNKVTIDFEVIGNAAKKIDDIARSVLGLETDINSKFNKVGSVFESAFSIFTTGAVLTGGIYAAKKALDALFEAENVKSINNQFELFAKNAGVATGVLKKGLEEAAGGLADDTDLLKVANKALIDLGLNAQKLPEVLGLARQVTSTFGGDLVENFQAISNAIATGQTKYLKQIGLIIDTDKAYKDYAETLGVTASKLSDSAKQTALLNAVLEKGQTAFKGVNTDANQVQNAYTRLKVSLEQAAEAGILAFDKIAGPSVSSGLNAVNTVIGNVSQTLKANLGDAAASSSIRIQELASSIKSLEAVTSRGQIQSSLSDAFSNASEDAKKAKEELFRLVKQQDDLAISSKNAAEAAKALQEAELKKQQALEASRIKAEEQRKTDEANRKIAQENEIKAQQDYFTTKNELETQQREAGIISDEEFYANQKATIDARYAQELADIEANLAAKKISRDTADIEEVNAKQRQDAKILQLENAKNKQLIQQRDAFLNLSKSLAQAQTKELQIIGKAAALTQIAIDTPVAVSGAFKFGSSVGGPALGFALAAIAATAEAALAAQVAGIPLANGIDSVPGVGDRDNFPAVLAPGERVVPKKTNTDLTEFLSGNGAMARSLEIIADRISNLENRFIVQIGERVIADEVRRGVESGRVVFA